MCKQKKQTKGYKPVSAMQAIQIGFRLMEREVTTGESYSRELRDLDRHLRASVYAVDAHRRACVSEDLPISDSYSDFIGL